MESIESHSSKIQQPDLLKTNPNNESNIETSPKDPSLPNVENQLDNSATLKHQSRTSKSSTIRRLFSIRTAMPPKPEGKKSASSISEDEEESSSNFKSKIQTANSTSILNEIDPQETAEKPVEKTQLSKSTDSSLIQDSPHGIIGLPPHPPAKKVSMRERLFPITHKSSASSGDEIAGKDANNLVKRSTSLSHNWKLTKKKTNPKSHESISSEQSELRVYDAATLASPVSPNRLTSKSDVLFHISMELLATERNYADSLRIVLQLFYEPLKESSKTDRPIINRVDLKYIFYGLPELQAFTSGMIMELEKILERPDFESGFAITPANSRIKSREQLGGLPGSRLTMSDSNDSFDQEDETSRDFRTESLADKSSSVGPDFVKTDDADDVSLVDSYLSDDDKKETLDLAADTKREGKEEKLQNLSEDNEKVDEEKDRVIQEPQNNINEQHEQKQDQENKINEEQKITSQNEIKINEEKNQNLIDQSVNDQKKFNEEKQQDLIEEKDHKVIEENEQKIDDDKGEKTVEVIEEKEPKVDDQKQPTEEWEHKLIEGKEQKVSDLNEQKVSDLNVQKVNDLNELKFIEQLEKKVNEVKEEQIIEEKKQKVVEEKKLADENSQKLVDDKNQKVSEEKEQNVAYKREVEEKEQKIIPEQEKNINEVKEQVIVQEKKQLVEELKVVEPTSGETLPSTLENTEINKNLNQSIENETKLKESKEENTAIQDEHTTDNNNNNNLSNESVNIITNKKILPINLEKTVAEPSPTLMLLSNVQPPSPLPESPLRNVAETTLEDKCDEHSTDDEKHVNANDNTKSNDNSKLKDIHESASFHVAEDYNPRLHKDYGSLQTITTNYSFEDPIVLTPGQSTLNLLASAFLCRFENQKWEIYMKYVDNYSSAKRCIHRNEETNSLYRAFSQECMSKKECLRMGLSDFLIMPIQRIARYVLLLQDLRKHTPPNHHDYEILSKTVDKMRQLANSVNEVKRREEEMTRLFEIQKAIQDCPATIVSASRRVLLESYVTEHSKQRSYRMILLSDGIILAKASKHNVMLSKKQAWKFSVFAPLPTVSFIDGAELIAEGLESKHILKLVIRDRSFSDDTGPKCFLFQFSSRKEKMECVITFQNTLRKSGETSPDS